LIFCVTDEQTWTPAKNVTVQFSSSESRQKINSRKLNSKPSTKKCSRPRNTCSVVHFACECSVNQENTKLPEVCGTHSASGVKSLFLDFSWLWTYSNFSNVLHLLTNYIKLNHVISVM
jgi:hypothetical protein